MTAFAQSTATSRTRRSRTLRDARLCGLELFFAATIDAASGKSYAGLAAEAIEKVHEILKERGVERLPNESLVEALARARNFVQRIASALDAARVRKLRKTRADPSNAPAQA